MDTVIWFTKVILNSIDWKMLQKMTVAKTVKVKDKWEKACLLAY